MRKLPWKVRGRCRRTAGGQRAGIPFGPDALRAAERTASRNVQHRYGRHVYDAGSFGLTRDAIERAIGFYRRRYSIPYE